MGSTISTKCLNATKLIIGINDFNHAVHCYRNKKYRGAAASSAMLIGRVALVCLGISGGYFISQNIFKHTALRTDPMQTSNNTRLGHVWSTAKIWIGHMAEVAAMLGEVARIFRF